MEDNVTKITKRSSDSKTTMTQLVMPNDTNYLGNLMGGNLMKWMDIVGAMCAMRHTETSVVTASVDNISFSSPIHLGEITTLTACITRVFNTSLEVYVEVYAEDVQAGTKRRCNDAYLTFVSLDAANKKPSPTTPIVPETEMEQERYDAALRRRQLRLILGGRMKPEEADDLAALFNRSS
ncbi:MAG: acyl-CoA thioesterase [Saprospiraceae bacterium]|nr:acyl-CoA thioesterase [Saprospiraceae bacterium]